MEAMYRKLIGPIDPKRPADAFALQLWLLKRVGLWAPETDNQLIQLLYTIYSYFFRWFFLYAYTATQILFFVSVEDLNDVAEGFFFLLTQIALLYKVEKFYSNRNRIKACEKKLRSSLFRPKDDDEDLVITESMAQTLAFCMTFLCLAHFTIATWALAPFSMEKMELPIVAKFPFNTDSVERPWMYALAYVYQVFGICMSACFNVATDTFASAIISQTNGQVRRLGIQFSKVGHKNEGNIKDLRLLRSDPNSIEKIDEYVDEEMVEINAHINKLKKLKNENYGEVVRCTIFHEHVLKFAEEVEDIFRGPIFAQLIASCIIICMTCFLMANKVKNMTDFVSAFSYLVTMVIQVLLFCWISNELVYSSNKLAEQAYFSNFQEFDRPTAKAMLLFMHRTLIEIKMRAGTIFTVTLSLPTFMGIMKSSYSYFAVLQSMQEK